MAVPQLYTQTVAGCFVSEPGSGEYRGNPLENPNLPLNDPGVWETVFADQWGTDAGISVTANNALACAPVWQAVTIISSDVAKLPLKVYRVLVEDGIEYFEAQRNHRLAWRLQSQPNAEETAVDFWAKVMVHALLWNNAYVYVADDGDLVTLLPDRTQPERVAGELIYVTEAEGKLIPLLAERVLHIKGLTITGMGDLALLKQARNSIALSLAQERFASKFFAAGGRIGGILELPQGMPKQVRDTVEEGFRRSYEGSDNPFKTVILRDNAKFHAAQVSPQDSQLVDANEQQARQIARWFNLPPSKLNLKDSTAYNAIEQANQAYLEQCLAIWLERISAQCTLKLLSSREQALYLIKHDVSQLLKMDMLKQLQAGEVAIRSRVKNPNEVRAEIGMLPYEGGDEFTVASTNAGTAPQAVEPEDDEEDDVEEPSETVDDTEEEDQMRQVMQRRVLFSLTSVARHKAKNPAEFIKWLDSKMKRQREEWAEIADGALEPEFFVTIHDRLNSLAETTTATDLPAKVDEIVTTFERQI